MINLQERSYQKELLDDPTIPFADIKQNMRELNTVNTLLGGHQITISGIKNLLRSATQQKSITVCEIGCGGGDNLQAIRQWCTKQKIPVRFTGIDIQSNCIDFARSQYPALEVDWIISDYKTVDFSNRKPDIIFSSLFCHHFTDAELITMLQWMKANSTIGFFINDLHRNVLAYYSIKWITGIFSRSYLVKNDAPLSVSRGFKITEWKKLFAAAGIGQYRIQWKWAFRHLIVYRHD